MSSPDLHRQAAQLRATADRIERARLARWHALTHQVATVTAQDARDREAVRRLEQEAWQVEIDAAAIRRQERELSRSHAA